MQNFTPLPSLVGGVLIGIAAAALLLFNGRIAGVSGIVAGLTRQPREEKAWRLLFVVGLLSGGLLLRVVDRGALGAPPKVSVLVLGLAGLLVGVGARAARGCTSGHGVCGNGRLSTRSMLVTATFIATGALTVFLAHRGGPS
jgi:uncharacterized membrane protein YedE/YeeE